MWHPDLADNIRSLREQLRLTQEQVADAAGISTKTANGSSAAKSARAS